MLKALWRALIDGLTDDEKVASSKNIPSSRLEGKNHTLFMTKMAKFDTPFLTEMVKKTIPTGAAHIYVAHLRECFRLGARTFVSARSWKNV